MKREECIGLLKRYAEYDGMGIPNLAGCKEAMRMAAELLEGPSLPSNLDEAAEKYAEKHQSHDIYDCYGNPESDTIGKNLAFRAGAEWMAGQGVSMLGKIGIYGVDVESITEKLRKAGFKLGEEVVIQIRKKQ